ncbi:hypothetical protein [Streptomyces aureocirculatus]|uniref:hypothetical protein n=1 Tax=Streptomyces aureocirculatus TaxID=67275 RepID=UPI00056B0038|nr:hypothetical protein [Streptomyces aureocirculatus]
MIVVACLLLPLVGLLLYGMDRIEERLMRGSAPEADAPRHARRRHLRLVRGGHRHAAEGPPATDAPATQAHGTEASATQAHGTEAPAAGAPSRASSDVSPSDRRRAHGRGRAHGRRRERRDRRLHTAA